MLTESQLHSYQTKSVQFAIDNKKCGLFLSLGAGKTATTLTVIAKTKPKTTLILAPYRVAKTVWIQEAGKWEHTQHLEFNQLAGLTPKSRLQRLNQAKGKINVINVELFQWLLENLTEWIFDMVIIDEFSMFKNPSAKRFKHAKKFFKLSNRVIGLTGTPAPNSLLNLWSQIFLLDNGNRLESTMMRYKLKYFHTTDRMGYVWEINDGDSEDIYQRVSDICMSLKAGDFIELPEIVHNDITVELSKSERKIYQQMETETILNFVNTGQTVTAVNAAVLSGKLIQLASGTVYDEEGNTINVHDKKLEAVQDMIEELSGDPVLVAYKFKSDLAKLRKLLPDAPIMGHFQDGDEKLCDLWNNKKIPIMLISPASAGHGLNLQFGGHNIIEYTPDWSWERTEQFYGRLARQNQTNPQVFVHRILTDKTFDQRVVSKLKRKESGQNALLEAVKMEIENVIGKR